MKKKKKPKKPKPLTTKQKDKIFHKLIKDRDKKCMRCGSTTVIQCAHILSRFYRNTRWDPQNSIVLCRGCHCYFGYRSVHWRRFIAKLFGPEYYEMLELRAVPLEE